LPEQLSTTLRESAEKLASRTGIGKRILSGIRQGRNEAMFKFEGIESSNLSMFKAYQESIQKNGISRAINLADDKSMQKILKRYAQKTGILNTDLSNKTQEEILEIILQKSGVGPCKFAQIISSEKSIMEKLSPRLQEIIRKTRSENHFSRSLQEAQIIVDKAFNPNAPKALMNGNFNAAQPVLNSSISGNIKLIKPLSAGTVGETYLAKTENGKECIVKMIKQNVDTEQLELEEKIFSRFISDFSPDASARQKSLRMLKSLYKDWSKELNFQQEFKYNKLLQQGAKRYKVADITKISEDKSCILMEKAEGIQMSDLMKILKDYKKNPVGFKEKYAEEIAANPWLADTEKVIKELPDSITKAFDEMFLFMKKGGKSIMHGDPHMGNYFITTGKDGKLIPVFIDTGNCVERNSGQIIDDLKFLSSYFVGNSKGLAKYFVNQCERDSEIIQKSFPCTSLAKASQKISPAKERLTDEQLIEKVAKEIDELIFSKSHNITDGYAVQSTIRTILEQNGLSMRPDASTALKAQIQFFTGISEAAQLDGKVLNVGTIVKDIPQALKYMAKSRVNPIPAVSDAIKFSYRNQTRAAKTSYQFLSDPVEYITITRAQPQSVSIFNPQEVMTA